MATNYPLSFDDVSTIGGPFVNVAPPVDPFEDIDAVKRNNLNEALLAVQARLGVIDSTVTTSVDWGTLTISGVPNQGLRFAGTHVNWPGLVGESGIFVADGTGNASYHKSGDPVGTFSDITGGGGSTTWDALYATDKTLDIDTSALIWTQTSTAGYGFQLLRNEATADSAIVDIHNQNASDNQPCLDLNVASTSSLFVKANYDSGGAGDEFFVDYAGNVGLKGALQRIVSGNLTVSTTDGKIILDADQNSNDGIEFYCDTSGTFLFNAGATNTGLFDVNVSSWNISGSAACAIATTDAITYGATTHSFTGQGAYFGTSGTALTHHFEVWQERNVLISGATDGGSYKVGITSAYDLTFAANSSGVIQFNTNTDKTLTTTKKDVIGAINEVNAGVGAIDWDSLYADSKLLTVSGVPMDITTSQQTPPLQLYNTHFASPNGDLLKMYDGSGPGVLRFLFHRKGNFELTPEANFQALNIDCTLTDVAGDISGATIDMAQSVGLTSDGRDVYGLTSTIYTHASDASTATAFHASYRAVLSGTKPAFANILYAGLYVPSDFHVGVWSMAGALFETDASVAINGSTLQVLNSAASGTSSTFNVTDGSILGATTDRFSVHRGGQVKIDANVDATFDGALRLTNEWDTFDATGMAFDVFSKKTTGVINTSIMRVFNNGRTQLKTHSTASAVPVMTLIQQDIDEAFINFSGTESANQTDSISTVAGDGPAVVGPLAKVGGSGWVFSKMVQVEINGNIEWIATYDVAP